MDILISFFLLTIKYFLYSCFIFVLLRIIIYIFQTTTTKKMTLC